ncbi:MAG: TetR/AcrR family transcriptional regulator [Sneathiellales bacterium]|nr:TetR/AcrR family transcriptional regulator [Sneathiellales bacterium]
MPRSDAVHNRELIMEAFHNATRTEQPGLPTMSEIVRLSGLGRGTVYRHFPDIGSLAFSFMSVGYEPLFEETRQSLRRAQNYDENRAALKDHLLRYRAYSKEHLSILTRPECIVSEGYILASTSNRQCVRKALRQMFRDEHLGPDYLEGLSDLIARVAEPDHIRLCGVTYDGEDPLAETSVETALSLLKVSI